MKVQIEIMIKDHLGVVISSEKKEVIVDTHLEFAQLRDQTQTALNHFIAVVQEHINTHRNSYPIEGEPI
jgi:hypothetical protein